MSDQRTVLKFFKVSKIPVMFGRLPSGEAIPFGPYTGLQAIAAGISLILCIKLMPIVGTGNFFANIGLSGVIVAFSVYSAGKLQRLNGNPLMTMDAASKSLSLSKMGSFRGKPVTLAKPCIPERTLLIVDLQGLPPDFSIPKKNLVSPANPNAEVINLEDHRNRKKSLPTKSASAVQHLLAQAASHEKDHD